MATLWRLPRRFSDDVIELDAGGGPGEIGVSAVGGLRFISEGPGEDALDVLAMVVLAGLLGLVAKDALVDADVVVVAEVGYDDVVEVDAGGGLLGKDRGGKGDPRRQVRIAR